MANTGVIVDDNVHPLKKNGWAAVIDWYGPYKTIVHCSNAAKEAHEKFHLPDFGLYMAIGRLKSFSLMPKKILYIGKNGDDSETSLSDRIKQSDSLQKIEKVYRGKATYWFGLLTGPTIGDINKEAAERTEEALIYSLQPVLNIVGLSQPEFRFATLNHRPRSLFGALVSKKHIRYFEKLIPAYCELRPPLESGDSTTDLIWTSRYGYVVRRANGQAAIGSSIKSISNPNADNTNSAKIKIWDRWWAERLVPVVHNVSAKIEPRPPLLLRERIIIASMTAIIFLMAGAIIGQLWFPLH